MKVNKTHDMLEWMIGITFLTGLVTAVTKKTIAGFTPLIWFLISIQTVLVTICFEVTTLREHFIFDIPDADQGKCRIQRAYPKL